MAASGATTPQAFAHIVWVESAGSTLKYARVAADGSVSGARSVRTGSQIASPSLAMYDSNHLAVVWAEQLAGKSQIRFARFAKADGTAVGEVVDVTTGEGDAVEPSLASAKQGKGGIIWIDTRSGQRQPYFVELGADGAAVGAAEVVSSAAVEPANPAILAYGGHYHVAWTDGRGGARAIYHKYNATESYARTSFASVSETRLSPAGEDAHHVRLPRPPTNSMNLPDTLNITWETGDSGNQVRLDQLIMRKNLNPDVSGPRSVPLSCSSITSSGDVAWVGTDYTTDNGIGSAGELAAWIDGDRVLVQGVSMSLLGRTPAP